jgi:uncharacterized membrane protein
MKKTILIPIITLVTLTVSNVFDVKIGTELQDQLADGILALITLIGVFTNHKKKE